MRKKEKAISRIFVRYIILVFFGIFLSLFYRLFSPLTTTLSALLLDIFYDVSATGNIILLSGVKIELINACIAGSAYYLLLILNLTTSMKAKPRAYSLVFSFLLLLFLNVLRIFILSVLYVTNFAFFDFTHKFFWYVLSIVFVVGIWFLTIWLFKIKNILVYSDIKKISC